MSGCLTVARPAGVEHVVCIRGEAHVQDTPAHITSLHSPLQVEAPPPGVVQADVLVYSEERNTRQKTKCGYLKETQHRLKTLLLNWTSLKTPIMTHMKSRPKFISQHSYLTHKNKYAGLLSIMSRT